MTIRTKLLAAFAALGILAAIVTIARRPTAESARRQEVARPLATPATGARVEAPSATRSLPATGPRAAAAARGDGPAGDVVGSTDPTSKAYDPITLMRTMSLTPAEIFQNEPRDPAFADAREAALRARLGERLRRRLAVDVKVDATCRTSSCEVTMQYPSGVEDPNAALAALDLDKLADTMQLGPPESSADSHAKGASIVLLFTAGQRDAIVYDQLLNHHQANDEPARKAP